MLVGSVFPGKVWEISLGSGDVFQQLLILSRRNTWKNCPIPLKPWEISRQVRCRGTYWVVNSDSALLKCYKISAQCLHVFKMQLYIFERLIPPPSCSTLALPRSKLFLLAWKAILPTADMSSLWNKQSFQWGLGAGTAWHSHPPAHTHTLRLHRCTLTCKTPQKLCYCWETISTDQ